MTEMDEEAATIALLVDAGLLPGADRSWPEWVRSVPTPATTADASSSHTPARTSASVEVSGATGLRVGLSNPSTSGGTTYEMKEEQMGDDRPTVYQEDGVWVFRASGVWRCDRELWAHMNGIQPEATPDFLQERFDRGNEHEQTLIDYATLKLDELVGMQQATVEMKVGKAAIVRGHIDGATDDALVEAKTMAEKTYLTTWLRQGIKGFPGYAAQTAVYAEALGLSTVQFVIGVKDDDGGIKDIKMFAYDAEKLGVTVKDVKKKIMRVMRMDEMPKCNVDQFPCPFVFLHDEKEIMVSTDEMLAVYANEIADARAKKKRAEDELKNWQGLMTKQLDTHDLKGVKVKAGKWEITDVVKKNVGLLDYARMKEDGIDVESYRGEPKTAETRYQTVKEVKSDE